MIEDDDVVEPEPPPLQSVLRLLFESLVVAFVAASLQSFSNDGQLEEEVAIFYV